MTPSVTAVPASLASTRAAGGDTTDVELVAAVRQGDDRAFERLYERYHRRIAAYIYGMVNDYGRAEDIAQDVFLSALRRMRETDRAIAFKPWVYEIAKNACIDQFRRARRSEEVSYDAEEGLGAAAHGRLATTGPGPDVAVDQKMTLGHLCGAFGGLSETHHQILVMRELEGLSYREIGERLGMSRPSVESTLFRARRRLTEEYAELTSGARCLRVQAIILSAAGTSLGTRDNRRLAAHVSHCQPCRRAAHAAGVQIVLAPKAALRAKVAAVLPFPAFLRRRPSGGGGGGGGGDAGSAHVASVAQWSAQLGAGVDPAIAGWAKAAVAAAAIALVGVGAGEGTQHLAARHGGPPATAGQRSSAATPATGPRRASVVGRSASRRASPPPAAPSAASAATPAATVGAGPVATGQATTTMTTTSAVGATPAPSPVSRLTPSLVTDLDGTSGATEPRPGSGTPTVPAPITPVVAIPSVPSVGVRAPSLDPGAAIAGATDAVTGIAPGH